MTYSSKFYIWPAEEFSCKSLRSTGTTKTNICANWISNGESESFRNFNFENHFSVRINLINDHEKLWNLCTSLALLYMLWFTRTYSESCFWCSSAKKKRAFCKKARESSQLWLITSWAKVRIYLLKLYALMDRREINVRCIHRVASRRH